MLQHEPDLFYQIDEMAVLNRPKVNKFGILVGQMRVSFRKVQNTDPGLCPACRSDHPLAAKAKTPPEGEVSIR